MGFYTPTVISQIKDGKVKALGVTSLARSPLLPNVPTLDEQASRVLKSHVLVLCAAGTPPEIVARRNGGAEQKFLQVLKRRKSWHHRVSTFAAITRCAFGKLIADDRRAGCRRQIVGCKGGLNSGLQI